MTERQKISAWLRSQAEAWQANPSGESDLMIDLAKAAEVDRLAYLIESGEYLKPKRVIPADEWRNVPSAG